MMMIIIMIIKVKLYFYIIKTDRESRAEAPVCLKVGTRQR